MKTAIVLIFACSFASTQAQTCQVELLGASGKLVSPYSGGCSNGLANGRGEYSYSFVDNSKVEVVVTVRGQFVDGKLDGEATTENTVGGKSNGMWKQNKRHGAGKTSGPAGGTFEGEWRDGRQWTGIGTIVENGTLAAGYRRAEGKQTSLCKVDGRGELNCGASERLALLGPNPSSVASAQPLNSVAASTIGEKIEKPPMGSRDQVPGEKVGEYILSSRVADLVDGARFTIETFTKTDGQRAEINGVKIYRMWYSAIVRYDVGVHPECKNPRTSNMNCLMFATQGKTIVRAAGERERMEGQLEFQQTEKGWRGPDGRAY